MQREEVVIVEADLGRADHRDSVRSMTAVYAREALGDGVGLSEEVLGRLIPLALESTRTADRSTSPEE